VRSSRGSRWFWKSCAGERTSSNVPALTASRMAATASASVLTLSAVASSNGRLKQQMSRYTVSLTAEEIVPCVVLQRDRCQTCHTNDRKRSMALCRFLLTPSDQLRSTVFDRRPRPRLRPQRSACCTYRIEAE